MPRVGGGQGRRVVDAVADHRDRAVAVAQLGDGGDLLGRQEAGTHVVDAGLRAHDGRRLGVVAGEHRHVRRRRAAWSAATAAAAPGAQRVADGDHAERAVFVADRDRRLALALEARDGRLQGRVAGVDAEQLRPPDEEEAAFDLGAHARPGDGAKALDVGSGRSGRGGFAAGLSAVAGVVRAALRDGALCGVLDDGARQRVLAEALQGGGDLEHPCLVTSPAARPRR